MRIRLACVVTVVGLFAGPISAQPDTVPPKEVERAAHALFWDLPPLKFVSQIEGECGADDDVNDQVAFCTSQNVILYRMDSNNEPQEAYELAHAFGHAVQVQHGVADIALREIRRRPGEEDRLRGWVTRQVECIAGFILSHVKGGAVSLHDLYDEEPLTDSHWGRDPLSVGPKVSIGLDARAEWLMVGLTGDLSACAVGEFGSELLVEALR